MAYDINAIKKKLKTLTENGDQKTEREKLNWFRPEMGTTQIRFLPYKDSRTGEPFQVVLYFDTKKLSPYRIVSPTTFDMDDPIVNTLNELRKTKQPLETWKFMKDIEPKEKYYAPIVVRGKEDEGVFVWEISRKLVNDIYGHIAGEDLADSDVTDPDTGYDFVLTVTKSDRLWNGKPVKDYGITPRMRPSPLHKVTKEKEALLESVPNLENYFKAALMSADKLAERFNSALAGGGPAEETESETGTGRNTAVEVDDDEEISTNVSPSVKTSIDDAFDDL